MILGGKVKFFGLNLLLAASLLLGCQTTKKNEVVEVKTESTAASGAVEPMVTSEEVSGPQAGDELEPIYFKYNSAAIEKDAVEILKQNVRDLTKNLAAQIQIEGHCDPRGSPEYNFHLGERRASAAKSFLVKMGIDASRIRIISYGEDKVDGKSEASFAKSRRASFVYLQ